jgi:hypothetical protein
MKSTSSLRNSIMARLSRNMDPGIADSEVGIKSSLSRFTRACRQGSRDQFCGDLFPDPKLKEVYGWPVGVAVAAERSLLVSDDGARLIWRIRYEGSAGR